MEKDKLSGIIIAVFILGLIIVGVVAIVIHNNSKPKYDLDSLAKCLTEKNVTMYGSVTCSHCSHQKQLFSESFKYITYIECSIGGTPEVCLEKNIERLPTWEINSERYLGVMEAEELASLSGCELEVI